ncbi:MAG: ankyrin repeat domain-containing protein, partial [Tannerellaceae bacterium]|nr:ankyrin repeat domain-containing protein [Tannerellaceae bacterium]
AIYRMNEQPFSTEEKQEIENTLVYAVYQRNLNQLKTMLPAPKSELNRKMKKAGAPLHIAATNGDIEIVRLLVEAKANINITDTWKRTALICAIESGHLEIAKYLIENGADITKTAGTYASAGLTDRSVPEYAIKANAPVSFIDYLIQKGADPNHINGRNHTLFVESAAYGHLEALKYFTPYRGDQASLNEALWWGIMYSQSGEIVEYLFSLGADLAAVLTERDPRLFYRLTGNKDTETQNQEVIRVLKNRGVIFPQKENLREKYPPYKP